MDTKELSKEQISAFADGELSGAQTEVVLAALRTEQGLAAWNTYHLVGDAARSDETAVAISPDFFSKFSARLEAEPTIIAPAHADRAEDRRTAGVKSTARRFAIPALALSLAAAIVIMLQPQPAAVVATATPAVAPSDSVASNATSGNAVVATVPAAVVDGSPAVATLVQDGEVVRDPKIDKFLGKHETFTPQQSSEQFSRSAAFKVDADK